MSAIGAVNLLIYVIIIVVILVVLLYVLKVVLGVLFIAPTVSATPAAYIETVGQVFPSGLVPVINADTLTSHLSF